MKIQNIVRVCFLFLAALTLLPFQWACTNKTTLPTYTFNYPTPTPASIFLWREVRFPSAPSPPFLRPFSGGCGFLLV